MRRLTLLSGPAWPVSGKTRRWILRQTPYVPIEVVDPASPQARRRFPTLRLPGPYEPVRVVDDANRTWVGEAAWLTVLWALKAHRAGALRLARAGRAGEASRVVEALVGEGSAASDEPPCPLVRSILRLVAVVGVTFACGPAIAAAFEMSAPIGLALLALAVFCLVLGTIPFLVFGAALALAPAAEQSQVFVIVLGTVLLLPIAGLLLSRRSLAWRSAAAPRTPSSRKTGSARTSSGNPAESHA